jgi:hypothetical protein
MMKTYRLTNLSDTGLDIFWLKDESLEDSANLPDPDVIAADIAEDLRTALEQFEDMSSLGQPEVTAQRGIISLYAIMSRVHFGQFSM